MTSQYTEYMMERKIKTLEEENENLRLVSSCAQDVLDFWSQFSFRSIRTMVAKMETLKQALELLGK